MQGDGAQPAGMETESKLASGTGKHFEFTIFVVDLSTILLKTQTEKQQKTFRLLCIGVLLEREMWAALVDELTQEKLQLS